MSLREDFSVTQPAGRQSKLWRSCCVFISNAANLCYANAVLLPSYPRIFPSEHPLLVTCWGQQDLITGLSEQCTVQN